MSEHFKFGNCQITNCLNILKNLTDTYQFITVLARLGFKVIKHPLDNSIIFCQKLKVSYLEFFFPCTAAVKFCFKPKLYSVIRNGLESSISNYLNSSKFGLFYHSNYLLLFIALNSAVLINKQVTDGATNRDLSQ